MTGGSLADALNAKLLSEGLVERKQDDGGVVHRWPSVASLVQRAPGNYHFQDFEFLNFENVRRVYLVPATDAQLSLGRAAWVSEMAELFVCARVTRWQTSRNHMSTIP